MSEASAVSQLQAVTALFWNLYNAAAAQFLTDQAAAVAVQDGNYVPEMNAGLLAARNSLNAALEAAGSSANGDGGYVAPILRSWAEDLAGADVAPSDDPRAIARRIYDRLVASSQTIQSRQITYDTPSAGGANVGTGSVKRLTVDANNFKLEAAYLDPESAQVTQDALSGTNPGQELWLFRGTRANRDRLVVLGSGASKPIAAKNASDSYVGNPSFAIYDDATTPTTIDQWAPGSSIANFSIDTAHWYAGFDDDGDQTHQSVVFKANDKLVQTIDGLQAKFTPDQPVYAQIAYNRSIAGADGTLTFRLGGVSVSVNLASAPAGWNVLSIPIGTSSWLKAFDKNDFTVEIEVSGGSVFGLRVDDVRVVPFDYWNGTWWAMISAGLTEAGYSAGVRADWLVGDVFTWQDELSSTEGKIQFLLFLLGLGSWPSSATPTIADPA